MSNLQAFLAGATKQAADDLIAAFERLPEDKRAWSPMGDARTALDQVAECAILNGFSAIALESRSWSDEAVKSYPAEKQRVLADPASITPLLVKNTDRAIAAIATMTDDELTRTVQTSFGPMTWDKIASYPYWNMKYHEGQINYIASMLGCLD